MAIGGGDSFSISAVLTVITIVGGLLLLFFPPLIKWLEKKKMIRLSNSNHLKRIMPIIPSISFSLALIFHISDHLLLNYKNPHVSTYLNESSSLLSRFLATFIGPSGKVQFLILIFTISISLLIYNRPKFMQSLFPEFGRSAISNEKLVQLSGFFWFILLAGLLPSNSFAMNSIESIGTGLTDSQISSKFFEGLIGLIILGLCISFSILSISLHSLSNRKRKNYYHLFVLIPSIILGLALTKISILFTGVEWYSNGGFQLYSLELESAILDSYFGSRIAIFVAIFTALILFLIVQYWERNVNFTKFEGDYRWLALGLTYLHGIIVLIFGAFFIMKDLESFNSIQGSLWYSLEASTPIITFGLIGSLLPIIGFDENVRPELWGWRVGIIFGILINILWNPYIVYALSSVIIILFCSFIIPFVVETNNEFSIAYKSFFGINLLLLTIYALAQKSIFSISTSILVTLVISFISAIIFENVINFKDSKKINSVYEQE